jgi:phosphonate transport system substrate-binding protein
MIDRRFLMLGAAGAALGLATRPGFAQDWKTKYPELAFAVIPSENATGVIERFTPLTEYLSKELGVRVKLNVVTDYAGVIEGQRSGHVHIGYYSAASYARAYVTGVKIEPFAIEVGSDGSKAYRAVFYVKKDSPYQKVEDLQGKTLGLVDPNSTSGNNVPRFALNAMKIDPGTFFGKVVYTGSHENAIFALRDGTVDVAANWWSNEEVSNLKLMETKGLPGIKYSDYRIIYTSAPIVNAPIAYLSDLPEDLKKAIREAFFNADKNGKAAFDKFAGGELAPWQHVTHKEYEPVVELIKFVDDLRKKKQ